MRRFVCAILSLLLLLSLVACNSDLPQGSETSESDTLESQETDKPTEKPTRPARPTEPPLDSNGEEEDIKVNTQYTALNYEDMKCMWLSQFDLSSI